MKRFWSKIEKGDLCWQWVGYVAPSGYGFFRWNGRPAPAHRVAWELSVGPIPDGMQIDHLCRNRPCVNPDHLEVVSPAENSRRGVRSTKLCCPHGHVLRWTNKYGHRYCQDCMVIRKREWRARKRAERSDNEK